MRSLLFLASMLLTISTPGFTASIEATGRAYIDSGDIESARERAISRATEQASMLAISQIAVTQSVRDGILEIDNLRVSTQTSLGAVELISETRSGNQLEVLIRAEVNAIEGCADASEATAYRKPLAITQWSIKHPAEANFGRLQQLTTQLPAYLAGKLEQSTHLKLIDARQHRLPLYDDSGSATAKQRARDAENLNAQYLLTANIESLAMERNRGDTPNILIDLAERTGLKSSENQRYFQLSAELIDSQSGDLLQRYRLNTSGAWTAPLQSSEPVSLERFSQEPYGKAVLDEISHLATQLEKSLACQPLQANILSVNGTAVWIDRGSDAGVSPGDRLSVARRVEMYDAMMQPVSSVEPTTETFTVERTEFSRALGRLSQAGSIAGIQPGDMVIGY